MSITQEQVNRGAKDICFTIAIALQNDEGALIGRNGTIELDSMINPLSEMKAAILEKNAGVFPSVNVSIRNKWRDASIEATQYANVLATGWYEPLKAAEAEALKCWGTMAIQIPLRSLEPYYVDIERQWTRLLSLVTELLSYRRLQRQPDPKSPNYLRSGQMGYCHQI